MDALEQYIRGGLAHHGLEVDDTDIAIIRVAVGIYGDEIEALAAADLSEHWVEPDLDPSRAPTA